MMEAVQSTDRRSVKENRQYSPIPMFVVDAFTDTPFTGNPAPVFLVDKKHNVSTEWMQQVASEMNAANTAFVYTLRDTDSFETCSRFGLRWFTPTIEVVICGHGTLGSAAALFQCVGNTSDRLVFETLSGELVAVREGSGINIELPIHTTVPQELQAYRDMLQATTQGQHVSQVHYSKEGKKLLVRLSDSCTRDNLEAIRPDFEMLMRLEDGSRIHAVTVTLKGSKDNGCVNAAGKQYDFISRHFAPWLGVPEDPVCGSAHSVLASYWAQELGTSVLYARQCSRRGGELRMRVRDDGRLDLGGDYTIVIRGSIQI